MEFSVAILLSFNWKLFSFVPQPATLPFFSFEELLSEKFEHYGGSTRQGGRRPTGEEEERVNIGLGYC